MEDDRPIVPTTLEHDLFGDEPPLPAAAHSAVAAKEAEDLEDAPYSAMAGGEPLAEAFLEGEADEDEDGGGLFGDGDDDEDEPMEPDDGLTAAERKRRRDLEYNEEDTGVTSIQKEERIAQVDLANFGVPAGGKVWLARLPNFLSLNSVPFDELMWDPEDAEDAPEGESQEAGAAKPTLPDENIIRWKWSTDEHGQVTKESNARVVRWSDGSLSLQLGAELFDIAASVDHSADLASGASLTTHATNVLSGFDEARGHGLTYLTARHDYAQLIEAQASVHGTLAFRPATLHSSTHRRLAGSIAARNVKGRGIKMAELPQEDPEKKKAEREKAELDRAKKAKREAQRGAGGGGGGRKQIRQTRFYNNSGDEEEEEAEEEEEDGAAYEKRSQPKRGRGGPLAQEDEYAEDDNFVVADESSEDESSGRKKRKNVESDGEPDEMEEAEARIEREERRRKERKKDPREEEPAQAPRRRLVVESDEDE